MSKDVGVIGMGLLGGAIAERLIEQGWSVAGYDSSEARREAMRSAGVEVVANAADVFALRDRVILCLPNDDVVHEVLGGVSTEWSDGQIVIDMTTGAPGERVRTAERLAASGVAYLDAPVAGSSQQARSGEAVVLVGGDLSAYEKCVDLFELIARHVARVGPCGAAAQAKLVHNLGCMSAYVGIRRWWRLIGRWGGRWLCRDGG